ncbi:hypothetical protein [Streptomyces chattanoogensis]|uniref:hypothetical protein n=1 Tax=Streptomyces chattanoogensis TaxID=66876 RepID=UPI0005DA1946|nr:hypothetical protein T261_7693 [Streptomyces lydicus]
MAAESGPEKDSEFFADIAKVFDKYPESAQQYALASLVLEHELGIDFSRQYGVRSIEGHRIVTDFHHRESDDPQAFGARLCDLWEMRGGQLVCVAWHDAEV